MKPKRTAGQVVRIQDSVEGNPTSEKYEDKNRRPKIVKI
jgi:hypothetical protein